MELRVRFEIIAVAVGVLSAAFGMPAQASPSGLYVDDDGIPEERNIEHLSSLGILDHCGERAEAAFCPEVPADIKDTVLAIFRSSLQLKETLLAQLSERWMSGLAVHLVGSGLIPSEVSRRDLIDASVDSFGLSAPDSIQSPWDDVTDPYAAIAAHHELFDPTATVLMRDQPVTRAELAEVLARAMGEDLCSNDPFTAARVAELEDRYPGRAFHAYAYDTRSGCAYWMNPEERTRTASVFKVMVMAGTLFESQVDQRELTNGEMAALTAMITESANWPVRSLWRRFGASPWFSRQGEIFGLEETTVIGDDGRSWGGTRTSAKDQVELLRQVLLREWGPLDAASRGVACYLMTSVIESQTWGVTAGVPDGWTVAQKNGLAGRTANSVGYIEEPDGDGGYFLAILTYGWPGWRSGVEPVEEVAGWVAEALATDSD